MKGIIIARNNWKPLMPLTEKVSKPMLIFFDRPLISYSIEQMKRAGIRDICVIPTEDDQLLKEYLEQIPDVSYFPLPKGGISLKELAKDHENCILFNDITVTDFDLKKFLEAHQKNSHSITAVFPEPDTYQTQPSVPAHAEGIWFFSPSAYNFCINGQNNLLSFFSKQNVNVQLLYEAGYCSHLSTVEEYLKYSVQLLDCPHLFESHREQNGVILSENTFLEVGAKIKPPVYIGENVLIQKNAEILPYSIICKNSTICESARIIRSVVSENCRIERDATITDSILSDGVTVTEGATIPKGSVYGGNLRVSNAVPTDKQNNFSNGESLLFGIHGILIPQMQAHSFLYHLGQICGTFFAPGIAGIFKDGSSKAQYCSHSLQAGLQSTGIPLYEFPDCTLAMAKSACPFYRLKAGFYLYETTEQTALMLLDNDGNPIAYETENALQKQMHRPVNESGLSLRKSARMKPYQLYYIPKITRRLNAKPVSRELFCKINSSQLKDYLQRVANAHKVTLLRQPKEGVIRFQCNPSATQFTLFDEVNHPLTKRQMETIIAALIIWEKETECITNVYTPRAICQYLQEHGVTPKETDAHPHSLEASLRQNPEQYFLWTDPIYLVMKILIYLSEHQLTLNQWITSLPKSFLVTKTVTVEGHLKEAITELLKLADSTEDKEKPVYRFQSKKGITTVTQNQNDITILSESHKEEYAKELTDFYVKQFTKK
ncbi:MAG: hypothetical protein IJ367_04480 [Clostridia bacterium]|nr:hypothetical protein [Clostridia bacterium]